MDTELRDYREAAARIFDARVFETMLDKNGSVRRPEGNPHFISTDRIEINNFLVKAHYTKLSKIGIAIYLQNLHRRAISLVTMIKKEYRIK